MAFVIADAVSVPRVAFSVHGPVSEGSKGRLPTYWLGKIASGRNASWTVVDPWVAVTAVGSPAGVTSVAPNTSRSPTGVPTVFGPTLSRRLKVLAIWSAQALACGQITTMATVATIPMAVRARVSIAFIDGPPLVVERRKSGIPCGV